MGGTFSFYLELGMQIKTNVGWANQAVLASTILCKDLFSENKITSIYVSIENFFAQKEGV
jgi:hypothetical protein